MADSKRPHVLAVIPARGGSKRLPRKNILGLAGHPMVAYSIKAVANAERVTDWLVSSDDEEIMEVARRYNAPVPYKRPPHLATDEVRNIEVSLHALEYMESERGIKYDIIVLVQPTAPIRNSSHIDEAIERLWVSDLPSLAAVKGPYQKRDPILKRIDENGHLVPYCKAPDLDEREPFYIYNAALYAVKRDYFVTEKKFISDVQLPYIMDKFHSADVDDIADFLVAESYLKYLDETGEE